MSSPLFLSHLPPTNNSISTPNTPKHPKLTSLKPNTNKTQSTNPTNESIKMPTPPWVKGPLLLPSNEILDLSIPKKKPTKEGTDCSLTGKVSGGRGKKAMLGIIQSVTKLQKFSNFEQPQKEFEEFEFHLPLKQVSDDGKLNCNKGSAGNVGNVGNVGNMGNEGSVPWAKAERIVIRRLKKERVVTAAELSLPEMVLNRLRSEAVKIKQWCKVKKAGVTQDVVDRIKMTWRTNELAMIKFEFPLCRNMDRAREIVEIKTGGLVVWSTNDIHVVYRGCKYDPKAFQKVHACRGDEEKSPSPIRAEKTGDGFTRSLIKSETLTTSEKDGVGDFLTCMEERMGLQSVNGTLYVRESDRLLDGLGPRYIDWCWPKPLPVDADLLPEAVPGYRTPYRRCPPHIRRQLNDDELTYLRKLARPLPTHFALGRNRKLQGLAGAIIKLWEKSLIAKIAIKLGVPNSNSEEMATELKSLTGGVLILRNKFFIIFYRGKDFIPSEVANLIVDRETELKSCQLLEEAARLRALEFRSPTDEVIASTSTVGTFSEFLDIQTKYGFLNSGNSDINVQVEAQKVKLEKELRKKDRELLILQRKIERSSNELAKLNSSWKLSEQAPDQELITDEERHCLRKIALKMDKVLILGRRGVFDGVIGSMHQHWKHREVVKVITMQREFSQVLDTAMLLEMESGGLLVAVEKLIRGHAIILYRGKNYRRPSKLLPENLLTKRAALQRSLEMQRIGSLKFFAYQRQRTISDLKFKLSDLQSRAKELTLSESEDLLQVRG